MDPSVTEGVVVVVRRGERYLVIRRAAGVVAPGAWCFVGGAIRAAESQEQAVVREFAEEVGGAVRPIRRLWQYDAPDGTLRLYWWLVEWTGGTLQRNAAEVAELRWCTGPEVAALPGLLASNREFLRVIGAGLDDMQVE